MGAQQSARRVTVDNSGDSDDTIGVVKISESLLRGNKEGRAKSQENLTPEDIKTLWQELLEKKKELENQKEEIESLLDEAFHQGEIVGSEGSPSIIEENLRKTLEEREQELDELRKKTKLYQQEQLKKNAEIEREVLQQFNGAVNGMQKKYSDKKIQPVCLSLQDHVLDCYQKNKNSSLKCSQLVRDYMNCVEQARKSTVQTL